MTAPDLTDQRHHAEAVAYGKLLAVREILDALSSQHPERQPSWTDLWMNAEQGRHRHAGRVAGYDSAVNIVKAFRIGVEK